MPQARSALGAILASWLVTGCVPGRGLSGGPPPQGPIPAEPPPPSAPSAPPRSAAAGPLELRIVYPREASRLATDSGWVIAADPAALLPETDSLFLFGSVGRGDATLSVNDTPVPVYRTGGWIAWIPTPRTADSVAAFRLRAAAASDTVRATLWVRRQRRFQPPDSGAWIDTTSFSPTGSLWLRPGEPVRLSLRAAAGAAVKLVLPDGTEIPLLERTAEAPAPHDPEGPRLGAAPGGPPRAGARYAGSWTGRLGPDPGDVLHPAPAPDRGEPAWPLVMAIAGPDTARARWPLRVGVLDPQRPRVVRVDDDTAGTGLTDSTLAGRAAPYATYHWFFPTGTIAEVNGRQNDQIRLRLSQRSSAWVDARDVHPLPPGAMAPAGRTGGWLRVVPAADRVTLRVPLPGPVPFRVDEEERALRLLLYGVTADLDFVQYGPEDPLVRAISFQQLAEDELEIRVDLAEAVWGYRTEWRGSELRLSIRRPPRIERRHPLRGRRIAVDPGHPPGGATGPTGLRESEAAVAVARQVASLLERAGASAVLLRSDETPLDLARRVMAAEHSGAEVLVSIHANALPDGVNPFVNQGTSVYYFHPHSLELARALDRALVRQLGLADLGLGRGDLAMARVTWMPAALCEGAFIMLPDQEALLRSLEGQRRYARGIVAGLEAFLRARAR